MPKIEFIYYFSASIFYIAIISSLIWFIVGLLHAWNYERKILALGEKINDLPKQIEERIKNHSVNQRQFERLIESEQKPLLKELEILEKKRRFILDKLPFIK